MRHLRAWDTLVAKARDFVSACRFISLYLLLWCVLTNVARSACLLA